MKRRRRIEVNVEIERVFAVALPRRPRPAWCEGCGAEAEMLSLYDAAARAGLSAQAVCTWALTGEVHAQLTADNVLLVCSPSLSRRCQAG